MTPARRLLALSCAAALLPFAHGASAATSRVVRVSYAVPGGVLAGTATTPGDPAASATTRGDEDRVTVTASDPGSKAVALAIDVTASGRSAVRHVVCTSWTGAVSGGTVVEVTPLAGRCADGRLSTPRGGTVSLSFRKRPVPAAAKGAPPALRYALVVGVKDYAGSTHDTVGAIGDALAVRRALIGSGWRSDHILTLTDGQASAAGIRNGLAWLRAHSSPRTFSVFHYSGHVCIASRGPCDSGQAWLWGQDNRMVGAHEVVATLKQVQGRQWTDIAGCEGGAFDVDGYASPTRMFTAASQADETAYEEPRWNESVWTGLTWDQGYLKGAAHPQGKAYAATIAQLASYGVTQAPRYTAQQARGPQHPVLRGGDRSWTLSAPPGG